MKYHSASLQNVCDSKAVVFGAWLIARRAERRLNTSAAVARRVLGAMARERGAPNKKPRDGNAGLEVAGVWDARQVHAIHAQHSAPVGRDCKTMFRQSSLPDPVMVPDDSTKPDTIGIQNLPCDARMLEAKERDSNIPSFFQGLLPDSLGLDFVDAKARARVEIRKVTEFEGMLP